MKDETFRPNRVLSYFQEEWKILFFVTVSGLIYNLGLLAGPWFEGKMTGKLVDLLGVNALELGAVRAGVVEVDVEDGG